MSDEIKLFFNGEEVKLTQKQIDGILSSGINFKRTPKLGDKYYIINSNGAVDWYTWKDSSWDNHCYNIGNCYVNKSEATQMLYRLQLNSLLYHYSKQVGGDSNKWDGYEKHWAIAWNCMTKEFMPAEDRTLDCGDIYFNSEENAQNAIDCIVTPFMKEHPDFNWGKNNGNN